MLHGIKIKMFYEIKMLLIKIKIYYKIEAITLNRTQYFQMALTFI